MIGIHVFLRPATLGLLAAVTAHPASAAIVTFTDRAIFEANVSGPLTTETFNDFTNDTSFLSPLDIGDFTISTESDVVSAGGEPTNQLDASPFSFGSSIIDGTTFGQAILQDDEALTFTFDAPIFAFGIDTRNLGNSGLLTSILVAGESFTPLQDGTSLLFSGVISDTAFSSVSFVFDALGGPSADGFAFDNVAYSGATVVPLPASLPLLVGALGVIGFLGRRRSAL
ncbi:hypothetical protein G5B40_09815 [Pikeienuella piscinae]|uniref:VPLPA-CTERM sorting domain-containing protein n=1 Tax=Pikeienuella piscinae TaxID=2748098 RepID=A0A7L5BYX8_9RHOB|nr:VPLPA-CTERM sorting domain-containing protein [Pikeienuella piscinae]QIE55717.1 hypothetical protein G5B40_09815 [Pikeienuella piscinae]